VLEGVSCRVSDSDSARSPDGKRTVFLSDRYGNQEIYVIDADRCGLTKVTNDPAAGFLPDGRPRRQQGAHYENMVCARRRASRLLLLLLLGSDSAPTFQLPLGLHQLRG
jgi:hypothetical protein